MSRTAPRRPQSGGALTFASVARSHVGEVRELNEDRVLDRPDLGLWAVADGMGGHEAGEVASAMVVEALAQVDQFGSGYAFLSDVCTRLEAVNRALVAQARTLGPGAVIGSTVVALLVFDGHYACAWAGDSRAYLLRDGALTRITHDHSLVQEMVDSGALAPAQAAGHRAGNVITRAVGVGELELERRHAAIAPGDLFLLCSDGLTGVLSDAEIAERLTAPTLDLAADELLALTLARGAPDNVSLVLVRAEG